MTVPLLDMQIARTAELSRDERYRWGLERRWNKGAACLWIMLNPSTANAIEDDPTIRRVIHFSHAWGFPAARVVNLFPFRSSSPAICKAWATSADSTKIDALIANERRILADVVTAGRVIIAWGNDGLDEQDRFLLWLRDMGERQIHCLGTTGLGAPTHPMARGKHRVPDDAQAVVWADAPARARRG